ncbi:MAG: DUF1573 domain-containing protein [Prevotellaceae bacterium]|nr:DUF1573 domain-containing protein [Prevotellaceae bacterium]
MIRMRNTMLGLLACMLYMLPVGAKQGQPEFLKTMVPKDRVHDFGTIYERDGVVHHLFELINKGKEPVVISAVNTWCGCMVADYTKQPIRPGETAKIHVSLSPDHKAGNFAKQVVVMLNDGKQYVRLWVKAQIVAAVHPVQEDHPHSFGHGLWMSQQWLPFPALRTGSTYAFELKMANDTDKPMTVRFKRVPNNTILQMPDEVKLKPRERTSIRVSYTYQRKYAYDRYIRIYPTINGKAGKTLVVKWNAGKKFRIL